MEPEVETLLVIPRGRESGKEPSQESVPEFDRELRQDSGLSQPAAARILFWHWGRKGAGSKFTFELVRSVGDLGRAKPFVSAVRDCELAALVRDMPSPAPLNEIHTFAGDKTTLRGKFAALWGLTRLRRIGRQFEDFVMENRIDAVVCTMLSIWDVAVLPALRRRNIPFVLFVHDAYTHPGDSYLFRHSMMRRLLAGADRIVVLSDHVRQQLVGSYRVADEIIHILPHGAFEFGSGAPRQAPRQRPFRLLFFGHILKYKGLGLLLDAYRLLRDEGLKVELEIMGSGDIRPYQAKLRELEGVALTNRWIEDEEIAPALDRADAMVLPYVEASQSGVAAAAAAAAMPTIATPVGGLAEQVLHEKTGLIADAITAESLADAIRRLTRDASLYARCSQGALAHARETMSWEAIAEKMTAIASEAARASQLRACAR